MNDRSRTTTAPWPFAIVVLLAVATAVAFTQPASAHRSCKKPGEKVVAENSIAMVVARKFTNTEGIRNMRGVYSCLRSNLKRKRFDFPAYEEGIYAVHIAGRKVASASSGFALDAGFQDFGVSDAYKRVGYVAIDGACPTCLTISDVVLKTNGSVAFIASGRRLKYGDATVVEDIQPTVFTCDTACRTTTAPRGPNPAVVDSGVGIAAGSLALTGSIVYWTSGGQPKSAPLD